MGKKNVLDAICGNAIGAVMECVDVDGVVRRLDVNDVVNRIDVNQLLDRIDWNALLDKVDWNRQLDRVHWNAILERIDVNDLVLRSDVGDIVSQSTTGVLTSVLDMIRTQIVQVDLLLHRIMRLRFCHEFGILPPKPGSRRVRRQDQMPYPRNKLDRAMAVQGRYTGFFPKAVAMFIDVSFITVSFLLMSILIKLCLILFLGETNDLAKQRVNRDQNGWMILLFGFIWGMQFFVGVLITGQTLGMAISGIRVVQSATGSEEITPGQVLIRTLLLPLTLTIFPPLVVFGLLRRDGRMIHDCVAGTGIIYTWNVRLAKIRQRSLRRMQQRQQQGLSNYYSNDPPPPPPPPLPPA